ncbi:MAG TPA: VWA domain-containing protein [Terriglobales bacterium]|nr:VWA domain-containing protein [Terriglobales bacterium]
MSRRKPGLAANPWTVGPLAAVLVGFAVCCLLPSAQTPAFGQGLPQQQAQQGKKSAPVHIVPGSASTVPGGVTPEQARPSPGKSAPAPAPGPVGAAGSRQLPQVPEFSSNVNLVLVPVVITDPLNRMVTGLEKNFFSITENNVPQKIETFSSEDAPISVGVVFDSSGSMSDKIQKSREALLQFFKTANPQDEFFLVDFADEPRMLCGFTSNIDQIEDSVTFLQPQGRTALLDAVYLSLEEMRHAKYARKALLIISDGGDNHSRYSERDVERVVREADVQIYGIGLYSPAYERATPEEMNGPALLDKITEATGGKTFEISDMDELADTATKIGIELRNQYVLGYSPTDRTPDGKWRKIQVKLHPPPGLPPLTVSARTGYYGPHR